MNWFKWPWSRPQPSPSPPPDSDPSTVSGALLRLHNDFRAAHKLAPIAIHPALMASAAREAAECANLQRLLHTSPDGATPFDRMDAAGYRYAWAGENIASGQPSPAAVFSAWCSDIPHRSNILNPHFINVGFAMARDRNAIPYWVADFGSPVQPGNLNVSTFERYPHVACAVAELDTYRSSED